MAVIGLEFGRAGLWSIIIVISCSIAAAQLTDSKSEVGPKGTALGPGPKSNLAKNINEIYDILSKSTKSFNKSGYIIQAKSDPKRLILIDEQQPKPPVRPLPLPQNDEVAPEDEESEIENINVHLHVMDPESHTTDTTKSPYSQAIVVNPVRGWRSKRSVETTKAELEASPDALQAMKRVIFIRCPFYSCPQGHICDYQTRSCRPVFYPDMDYE